jgi:phage gp36-like protein
VSRYATPADLARLSLPATAIDGISADDQQAALDSASDIADGYLAARFNLPLVAPFPGDLVQKVCDIGALLVMKRRGFNPAGDDVIVKGHDAAMAWLKDVSRNLAHPQATDSSPASPAGRPPRVVSRTPRGW